MPRLLLTGMSGTGKSTVAAALAARGAEAADADVRFAVPTPDGRQRWDVAAVRAFLAPGHGERLVVLAGCEEEIAQLRQDLDLVVLLTAPREVIAARLAARPAPAFGHRPEEAARVMADLAAVEPLLRAFADVVLDTSRLAVGEVVDAVLDLSAGVRGGGARRP